VIGGALVILWLGQYVCPGWGGDCARNECEVSAEGWAARRGNCGRHLGLRSRRIRSPFAPTQAVILRAFSAPKVEGPNEAGTLAVSDKYGDSGPAVQNDASHPPKLSLDRAPGAEP
jgi:hypothetical protein